MLLNLLNMYEQIIKRSDTFVLIQRCFFYITNKYEHKKCIIPNMQASKTSTVNTKMTIIKN